MRQVLGSPATAHLHDSHAVPLVGQSQRADAAAEPGADHDEVEVEHGIGPSNGSGQWSSSTEGVRIGRSLRIFLGVPRAGRHG